MTSGKQDSRFSQVLIFETFLGQHCGIRTEDLKGYLVIKKKRQEVIN